MLPFALNAVKGPPICVSAFQRTCGRMLEFCRYPKLMNSVLSAGVPVTVKALLDPFDGSATGAASGEGCMNYDLDMPPYVADMAAWLDDDRKVHPCNGESAYKGFEIAMAITRSVVTRGQVALPLGPGEPELDALRKVLPAQPVMLSTEANRQEYGLR